jgi:hypothetical protein
MGSIPDSSSLWNNIGMCYFGKKKYVAVSGGYSKYDGFYCIALKLDPSPVECLIDRQLVA